MKVDTLCELSCVVFALHEFVCTKFKFSMSFTFPDHLTSNENLSAYVLRIFSLLSFMIS